MIWCNKKLSFDLKSKRRENSGIKNVVGVFERGSYLNVGRL